jgi:hypothetical protein
LDLLRVLIILVLISWLVDGIDREATNKGMHELCLFLLFIFVAVQIALLDANVESFQALVALTKFEINPPLKRVWQELNALGIHAVDPHACLGEARGTREVAFFTKH